MALNNTLYSYNFWNQDSATAFTQLEALSKAAIAASDKELVLETKLARILYCVYNNLYNYKYGIEQMTALADEAGDNDIFLLRLQNKISLQYYYNEMFGEAIEHQMKYYNKLKTISHDDFPEKKNYIAHIGVLYYTFEDFKLASRYLHEAFALPQDDINVDIDIANTLGLVMRNTARYDSAIYYFNYTLETAEKNNIQLWPAVAKGNLGIIYFLQKKYDKAIPLLKEDIYRNIELNMDENIVNSIIKLAQIYHDKKATDSATHYALMARRQIGKSWNAHEHLVPLYRLLGELAAESGNTALAYKYADSANITMDTLAAKKSGKFMARVQLAVQEEKHKMDMAVVVSEAKAIIQKRNYLVLTLSLTTIIGLLLLNRQLIRRKKLMAEKDLADNKLQNAQDRLAAFTKTLHEKNTLLETTTNEIKRLNSELNTDTSGDNEVLLQLQNSTILTDDEWNDFRELFEQVHSGFMFRLRKKVPDLTPAETRFIVLSKLLFSYKEMSAILGVSTVTLRSLKSRLIKKLPIEGDTDFESFVETI